MTTPRDESIHDDGRPCSYFAGACNLCGATEPVDHEADCLMCAVRALTEGDPAVRWPTDDSMAETVSGVVLRQGEVSTNLGQFPFVDLWLGRSNRVRVMAYNDSLRHALSGAAAQVGDRLTIRFDGEQIIDRPGRPLHGRPYKTYTVEVQRGH
jgi:hypothetical protein